MAKLLFFGRFSDVSQDRDIHLSDDIKNTDDLKRWLVNQDRRFAALIAMPGSSIVVNSEKTKGIINITNADEIAFLSPLSGG